jgi:predicted phosphoribosyltransferase
MLKSFKRKRLKKLEIELNRRCIKYGEKREIKKATKKAIFIVSSCVNYNNGFK